MNKAGTILLLAAGHGLNDLLAGYFLGSIVQTPQDITKAGLSLLVYNLLAFGGQYPVALWLEKYFEPRLFLIGAYALNVMAALFFTISPSLSVVMMGVASAVYHVAGGTVCANENKAFNIGLFAAPGVAGLIAGGYFAWQEFQLALQLQAAAVLFLLLLLIIKLNTGSVTERKTVKADTVLPDRHDMVMILLLTVISLRSAIWNIFQLVHEKEYEWLIAIAVAAFAGKIIGGWLADRLGWHLYIYISLVTALPLLTFFKNEMFLFCTGVGLLQSGIPASTALLIKSVKGKTARGISLSFGVAIIVGAVVFCLPPGIYADQMPLLSWITLFIVILMLVIMFLVKKKTGFKV